MEKYGIDNVRGGSYSKINLGSNIKELLGREIRGSTDKCFACGSPDHFVLDCDVEKKTMRKIEKKEKTMKKEIFSEYKTPNVKCFSCGKMGHYANQCRKVVICYRCEEVGHYADECKEIQCFKCKGFGHYANYCYSL